LKKEHHNAFSTDTIHPICVSSHHSPASQPNAAAAAADRDEDEDALKH